MSDELANEWHLAVCAQLESRVKNRDFFLWVSADPGEGAGPPEETSDEDWQALGEDVANWLGGTIADSVDPNDPAKHETSVGATRIELSASPKKPNRRGSDPLVLNLYPGMAYFTGRHSTGPAHQPPDED